MISKLNYEEVALVCAESVFAFATTADLSELGSTIGQERAFDALDFGLSLTNKGFNIYALGESGTGKMRTIRQLLTERAAREPVPDDWCYVFNFSDPDAPLGVRLRSGQAIEFQRDMELLLKSLRVEIPRTFESKEYDKQRAKVVEEFQQKQKELFTNLEQEAQSKGFAIRKAAAGLMMVPVKKTGEGLTEEEFAALDKEMQAKVQEIGTALQEKLEDIVRAVREAEKILKAMLAKLEREIALSAIGHFIDELKKKYDGHERILSYLGAVQEDVLSHLEDFKPAEEQPSPVPFMKMPKQEVSFAKYTVNVLVNNTDAAGAPVVFESNPTYLNLFGRIEYKVQYGMALSDFTMIRAGSLHRANNGYLVINALDLLKNIFSYDALKRALRNLEIKIEDAWEQYRLVSTVGMKPEPVPLNVKVILVGNPYIYYMLYNLDDEYRDLFKVKADFDSQMERTPESIEKYAAYIASCQREDNLLPFDRGGVCRIIEYGARIAGHRDKLTTRFSAIADMVRESHFWAKRAGSQNVEAGHVVQALEKKVYRSNRIEERIRELMYDDTFIVNTSGSAVGQVNGLAVLSLGDYSFGKPSRITAKTHVGKAGVVNIERETKMSGKIHEKAIMIISSYLGSTYARKRPISLSASITFEQLYEMIEGDSATCAELYALLSSISGVPLKQSFAVTGSMDQNGDVQPIGGVNEKLEGFFELCKLRGLDGTHGAVIPRRNLKNLMLKQEVADAVRNGKFSVYAIDRMEEGLEILTGMPAGELQEDGTYPEGTVNYLVMKRFDEITLALEKKKNMNDGEKEAKRRDDESN
ncbi:MAG: ATP-dependent protease La [Nitrospirae bacterium]|nr:MAG: ATP-dependent protease La [Nitrospirota bacterium]